MFTVYQEDRFGICEEVSFKVTPWPTPTAEKKRLGSAAGSDLRDLGGVSATTEARWTPAPGTDGVLQTANSTRIEPG